MTNNPFGSNPFETVFKDLIKVMASQGDLAQTIAEQFAMSVAASDSTASNSDPLMRMKIESLFDLAQRNIATNSMLGTYLSAGTLTVSTVTQMEYAKLLLDDFRGLVTKLESISKTTNQGLSTENELSPIFAGLPFAQMSAMLGPFLSGMNVGSCVGHLAKETLATFDLVIPRHRNTIAVVSDNLITFAHDWNLNLDELILWVCLNQITLSVLISRSHIATRIKDIMDQHLNAALQFSQSLTKRLEEIDMTDASALEKLTTDPSQLVGVDLSEAQKSQMRSTMSTLAIIVGLADYITSGAARSLLGNFEQIAEAVRRRRLENREGESLFENLFGIGLHSSTYEAGHKFIFGIVERNEEARLATILESIWAFPTPNEVEAPGLWLARLETAGDNRLEP